VWDGHRTSSWEPYHHNSVIDSEHRWWHAVGFRRWSLNVSGRGNLYGRVLSWGFLSLCSTLHVCGAQSLRRPTKIVQKPFTSYSHWDVSLSSTLHFPWARTLRSSMKLRQSVAFAQSGRVNFLKGTAPNLALFEQVPMYAHNSPRDLYETLSK